MLLCAIGCLFLVLDPDAKRDPHWKPNVPKLEAAAISFGSSIFGAIFMILTAKSAASLPLFLCLILIQIHLFIITATIAAFFDPGTIFWSLDPIHGCFGFLNLWDQDPWPVILYGVFAGFIGQSGYTVATLYFSPFMCSMCFLTEPPIAQIEGFLLGMDKVPGWLTYLGGIVAIIGIVFIEKGSHQ